MRQSEKSIVRKVHPWHTFERELNAGTIPGASNAKRGIVKSIASP